MLRTRIIICASLLLAAFSVTAVSAGLSGKELLGKKIYDDKELSINNNQGCVSCHTGSVGWTGPDSSINANGAVMEGAISGSFGDRKPPSSAYATQSPLFDVQVQAGATLFVGGNFWDGRATGWKLGNPAADQAQGPFLNPKEQALPDAAEVVSRVCSSDYADLFMTVWGATACDTANIDMAYDLIGLSVAAYEASREVNQFSSKFDAHQRGRKCLNKQEILGKALFMGKGKCNLCHVASGRAPLFTDYTFDNLGIPKNPENPATIADPSFVDPGLGGFLRNLAANKEWRDLTFVTSVKNFDSEQLVQFALENDGKHKVPTLRNVDKRPDPAFVKAFGHNGYFKSLERIVHFYNTRDVLPVCAPAGQLFSDEYAEANNCWPSPENPSNVNSQELGNLNLSAAEEAAIVAFMKTLTDGYKVK
ncbi:MAG TPA: cytochrome C [Geobacter sp.]|nr:cytochrome C [Geobacter sp.]